MPQGKELHIRLFLEGQEVPVISAQVKAQVSSPATAGIQVVATDNILKLKPRTLVHLFFLDPYDRDVEVGGGPGRSYASTLDKTQLDSGVALGSAAEDNRKYKLLFSGEVLGINFVKTAGSRQAVLKCADFTTYWDSAKQYYKNNHPLSAESRGKVQAFIGASTRTYTRFLGRGSSGEELVTMLTKGRPNSYKDMRGLLGGLVRVMESMGGVSTGRVKFKGINDFFSISEMRLKLMLMVGALPHDNTSIKLLKKNDFRKWLSKKISGLGGIASYRQVINEVLRHIYHVTAPNPSPFLTKGGESVDVRTWVKPRLSAADQKKGENIERKLRDARNALDQFKDAVVRSPPPHGAYTATDAVASTVGPSHPLLNASSNLKAANSLIQGPWKNPKARSYAVAHIATLIDASLQLNILQTNSIVGLTYDTAKSSLVIINTHLQTALLACADLTSNDMKGKGRWKKSTVTTTAGLYNTLVIPDCWFVAPPRCNVIFPDQYTSFTFSRSFLRETTRLQLSTTSSRGIIPGTGIYSGLNHSGSKNVYLAPDKELFKLIGVGPAKEQVRRLLPHEIYSGIIPGFEWMGKIGPLLKGAKGRKRKDYIQRIVNFQLLKRRFSARALGGNGVFNPYLVVGFPAIIIDRATSVEMTGLDYLDAKRRLDDNKLKMPSQYKGLLFSITHNVSQQGGTTAFQMTHVHTTDEDEEFLAMDKKSPTVATKTLSDTKLPDGTTETSNSLTKAAIGLVQVLNGTVSLGTPYGPDGKLFFGDHAMGDNALGFMTMDEIIAEVQKGVAASILPSVKEAGARALKDLNFAKAEARRTDVSSRLAKEGGTVNPNETWIPALTRAKELIASVRHKTSERQTELSGRDLPAEEAIRPPFFDSIYGNDQIGEKVYKVLIGTGAIVDDLQAQVSLDLQAAGVEEFSTALGKAMARSEALVEDERLSVREREMFLHPRIREFKEEVMLPTTTKSTEEAVNYLILVYSYMKKAGASTDTFLRDYIRRPIANMVEIFGGTLDGKPVEGFHENAFGDVEPMAGLVTQPLKELGEPGTPEVVAHDMDPRRERYLTVQEYMDELRASRVQPG